MDLNTLNDTSYILGFGAIAGLLTIFLGYRLYVTNAASGVPASMEFGGWPPIVKAAGGGGLVAVFFGTALIAFSIWIVRPDRTESPIQTAIAGGITDVIQVASEPLKKLFEKLSTTENQSSRIEAQELESFIEMAYLTDEDRILQAGTDRLPRQLERPSEPTRLEIDGQQPQDGQFERSADQWYRFDTDPGDPLTYVIETFAPVSDTAGVDTIIRLYRESDSEMVFEGDDDDGGEGTYSRLVERLQPGRSYYLQVSSYSQTAGSFRLTVSRADETPEERPSFVWETIDDMIVDQWYSVTVNDSEDDTVGWYSVSVPEDGEYAITTLGPSVEPGAVDTVIRLYSDNPWIRLGEDDDGRDDAPYYSRLVEYLEEDSLYYIHASSYWRDDGGQFLVSIVSVE